MEQLILHKDLCKITSEDPWRTSDFQNVDPTTLHRFETVYPSKENPQNSSESNFFIPECLKIRINYCIGPLWELEKSYTDPQRTPPELPNRSQNPPGNPLLLGQAPDRPDVAFLSPRRSRTHRPERPGGPPFPRQPPCLRELSWTTFL